MFYLLVRKWFIVHLTHDKVSMADGFGFDCTQQIISHDWSPCTVRDCSQIRRTVQFKSFGIVGVKLWNIFICRTQSCRTFHISLLYIHHLSHLVHVAYPRFGEDFTNSNIVTLNVTSFFDSIVIFTQKRDKHLLSATSHDEETYSPIQCRTYGRILVIRLIQ